MALKLRVFLMTFCIVMHCSNSAKQRNHMITLWSFQSMEPANQSDPIHRKDFLLAYNQRHQNNDYGFSQEFEVLPRRFNDRTTVHSDAKVNSNKNRYNNIKTYDQTRVKLTERK